MDVSVQQSERKRGVRLSEPQLLKATQGHGRPGGEPGLNRLCVFAVHLPDRDGSQNHRPRRRAGAVQQQHPLDFPPRRPHQGEFPPEERHFCLHTIGNVWFIFLKLLFVLNNKNQQNRVSPSGEHFWSRGTRPSPGGHGQREETAGWPWRVDGQHGSRMLKILLDKLQLVDYLQRLKRSTWIQIINIIIAFIYNISP